MSKLMVHSDARFSAARVVAVDVDDTTGALLATVSAEHGRWFAPDSHLAGADGWVRNLERIVVEFSFGSFRSAPEWREASLKTLRRWRDEQIELDAVCSLEHQLIALSRHGHPDEIVAVQMPPADLDRV